MPPAHTRGHQYLRPPGPRSQVPQRARRAMRERGFGTASEHRGHPESLAAEHRVPDGEHAAADAVQPPGPDPTTDAARAEAELTQLRQRDDAVLARRQLSERQIDRPNGRFRP
jgi:hypothetical protein